MQHSLIIADIVANNFFEDSTAVKEAIGLSGLARILKRHQMGLPWEQ